MSLPPLSDEELVAIRRLCEAASPLPWKAMIEGREHSSGDDFIMVGPEDKRDEDMYVARDSGPASPADLDFIAASRNYIPRMLEEITHRRRESSEKLASGGEEGDPF